MGSSRNNILARLKAAQDKRGETGESVPDFTSPIYHPLNASLKDEFKINLEQIGGKVEFCDTSEEIIPLVQQITKGKGVNSIFCTDPALQNILKGAIAIESEEKNFLALNVGLTGCEYLVAHLGSVVISSAQVSGRRLNVFPETHIVVAHESQLVDYLDKAMENMKEKYKNRLPSLISNITGPSRTADIEKTLVMGMHGPKTLIVIIVHEPF